MNSDLPTFIVIGAMKAGTTTLYGHLSNHPDIFMSATKELRYFTGRENWERGAAWYRSNFASEDAVTALARGEASPGYSQGDAFPGVPERMVDLIPDVRLVYLVRHPVERIRSMYLHQLASGRETEPIDVALRERAYYLNSSRYAWQLDHYDGLVPRDHIKVVTTERLLAETPATLAEIYDFVGVDPDRATPTEIHRGRSDEKRVPGATRRRLAALPGYHRLVALAPEPARRRVRTLTTRPLDRSAAHLDPVLERELTGRLAPDVERMREWLGDDVDRWAISAA